MDPDGVTLWNLDDLSITLYMSPNWDDVFCQTHIGLLIEMHYTYQFNMEWNKEFYIGIE